MRCPVVGMNPAKRQGQHFVATHGKSHPGGSQDGGVQRRYRGQQSTENNHGNAKKGHEVFGRLGDGRFLIASEKFPGSSRFRPDGPDTHGHNQQVNQHGHGKGYHRGAGDGFFRGLDLLGHRGDQVIAFKGDEGQPHGHHDPSEAFREKGFETGGRLGRDMKNLFDPVNDKNAENDDLGHGDDVFDVAGQRGSPHVDQDKNHAHQHCHEKRRSPVAGHGIHRICHHGQIGLNEFPEIAAKSAGIQGAGNDIAKPEHPAGSESRRSGEGFFDVGVSTAGFGINRGQLGIAQGGQKGHKTVEGKGQQGGRARLTGGDTR